MSLAATEQAFGGAAAVQTARFDQVFQAGLAKHDNFFAAAGDFGSLGISKQHAYRISRSGQDKPSQDESACPRIVGTDMGGGADPVGCR
jgi:hypothetical protein